MYLTNNEKTIYNLILYSEGVYHKRQTLTEIYPPSWFAHYYLNMKPYGNIRIEIIAELSKNSMYLYRDNNEE